jgi:alpha-L-fucosidase
MGQWLGRYGESIYGTRGGPYMPGPWGGATRQGNKVYLHVLQELLGGELVLPALPLRVVSQRMLTGGTVTVQQDQKHLRVVLDEAARSAPIDRIVELELDGDALEIEPIKTDRSVSLTQNATATASSEYSYERPSGRRVCDAAANAIGSQAGRGRYWTASADDAAPWIAVDLGKPVLIRQICLVEKHTRIRAFEVQFFQEVTGRWQTIYKGGRVNYCSVCLAKLIAARRVRVNVLKTEGGPPQIGRIDLFE